MQDEVLRGLIEAKRESKRTEFKETFDPSSLRDWCEIVKDVVAISNSGGGYVLFGLKNDGSPSNYDVAPILALDPAKISDKVGSYIGEPFSDFELIEYTKQQKKIAILAIEASTTPLVFVNPGSYIKEDGKQANAFQRGSVYFRHGAKSEPAVTKDLRDFMDLRIEEARKSFMSNVRKVIKAPIGHDIKILPKEVVQSSNPGAMPIRIVDDPEAPVYRLADPNETHPHKLKEIVDFLNSKIAGRKITIHDVICVKKVYENEMQDGNFIYKPIAGSPQYSRRFIDWALSKSSADVNFFDQTRKAYQEVMRQK